MYLVMYQGGFRCEILVAVDLFYEIMYLIQGYYLS